MSQKRIVTRSDFDGLVCAVLLKKVEDIGEIKFVHPKDVQDGKVEITANDILANIPFDPRCHLCFDHHSSEAARIADDPKRILLMAPSAARVIYDHYGAEKFPGMKGLVESTDRVDSADLEMEDVTDPKGWILLGFIMDPRTGLGRFRHFKISNYQLMMNMVDSIGQSSAEEVLAWPYQMSRSAWTFTTNKTRCLKIVYRIFPGWMETWSSRTYGTWMRCLPETASWFTPCIPNATSTFGFPGVSKSKT